MTVVTVDLTKNPELAALVSDLQPGDWIALKASLKSKDEQTAALRLEECDNCEKPKKDEDEEGADGADDTMSDEATEKAAEKPSASLARKLTAAANPADY